jgi:hypothetical protein
MPKRKPGAYWPLLPVPLLPVRGIIVNMMVQRARVCHGPTNQVARRFTLGGSMNRQIGELHHHAG